MRSIRSFVAFLREIFSRKGFLFELAKRDFERRYFGSSLGVLWGFIQPIITVAILVFIFEVGFKTQPIHDVPFVIWFMTGMVPWFFLAEAVGSGTQAILEYEFLVKKVAFRLSLLPVIKIISASLVHVFFLGLLVVICFGLGYRLELTSIQVLYYSFAAVVMCLGITWLTSALIVFLRDVGQLVTMMLSFAFWLTPLMWDINTVDEKNRVYFYINPFSYVVEGYRKSLIYHEWFWEGENGFLTIMFWSTALVLFVAGGLVFRQLKPHFADVI